MNSNGYEIDTDPPLGGGDRPGPPPEPRVAFVWRCAVCLRRQEFDGNALGQRAREKWPKCCGQTVLAFLAECEPSAHQVGK